LADFNQPRIFWAGFRKIIKLQISWNSVHLETRSMWTYTTKLVVTIHNFANRSNTEGNRPPLLRSPGVMCDSLSREGSCPISREGGGGRHVFKGRHQRFRGPSNVNIRILILEIWIQQVSETSIVSYSTARCRYPEVYNINFHHLSNLAYSSLWFILVYVKDTAGWLYVLVSELRDTERSG